MDILRPPAGRGQNKSTRPCAASPQQPACSPPPSMQPEPLFRVLADPALDDAGDDLHRALDVDFAFGVARRRDLVGQLAPERIAVGLTNDAHTADRRAG